MAPCDSGSYKSISVDTSSLAQTTQEPRKYRGVFPVGKRFRSVIQLDGVRHNLGMHSTAIEAARAYDQFAKEHYKKTNFQYPSTRDHTAHSTTSARGHSAQHSRRESAADGLSNQAIGINEFSAQSISNQQQYLPISSWPATVATSTTSGTSSSAVSMVAHPHSGGVQGADSSTNPHMHGVTPLSLGQNIYGNGYSSNMHADGLYLAQPYHTPVPVHSEVFSLQHDLQQAFLLQQSHLLHTQHMLQQKTSDSYLTPLTPALPQLAHPVVYVPVPLRIIDEVRRYVNDYLRLHQQQTSAYRAPIFMPPQTSFPPPAISAHISTCTTNGVSVYGQQQSFNDSMARSIPDNTNFSVPAPSVVHEATSSALVPPVHLYNTTQERTVVAPTASVSQNLACDRSVSSSVMPQDQTYLGEEEEQNESVSQAPMDSWQGNVFPLVVETEKNLKLFGPEMSETYEAEEEELEANAEAGEKEEEKEGWENMEEECEDEGEEDEVERVSEEEESESDFDCDSSGSGSDSERDRVSKRTRLSTRSNVLNNSVDSACVSNQSCGDDAHEVQDSTGKTDGSAATQATHERESDQATQNHFSAPKSVLQRKKRVRKSRRKVSAAEEARLAASHPAASYITTIGPNPYPSTGTSTSMNKNSTGGGGSGGGNESTAEAWRQQVRYYWHGTLLFDPERCVQVWRGSWLGTPSTQSSCGSSGSVGYAQPPTLEAFEATETTFEYLSTKVRKHNVHQSAQDNSLVPQSGYFKGYFKMRSTKIKAYIKHPDHNFYMVFEPYSPGTDGLVHEYALYGRGVGEYGAFIVHGRYSNQTGLMQAVRVYLHEDDNRAKMTLKQLQAWFQQGGSI